MESTSSDDTDSGITRGERCLAVAIKVMKPTDGPGLEMAIDYGRKIHDALVEMDRKERGGGVPARGKRRDKLPGQKLSADERATIERMAKAQDSTPAIMRETGLPESTIRGVITRNGWRTSAPAPESEAAAPEGDQQHDRAEDVGQDAATLPPPPSHDPPAIPADAASDARRVPIPAEAADRNRFRTLTDEELALAQTRWERDDTVTAIAGTFNVAESTISDAAKTHGWKRPVTPARAARQGGTTWTEEQLADIRQRYETGDAVRPIADKHGVSAQTIYNLAAKHGWRRSRVEGQDGTPPVRPAQAATTGDHHRAWSADKVRRFTEAWLRGDDAEIIGEAFGMAPGTVAAAASGLGIADDPRRKEARRTATSVVAPVDRAAPPTAPAPAPVGVKPLSGPRRAAIQGMGDFLARKKPVESVGASRRAMATASSVPSKELPSAEPDRAVMLMDGPDLAGACRRAGFVVSQIAGTTVPQWRIGNGDTVLTLEGMRRLVAGLRQRSQAAE